MWNASRFCVSSLRRGHANLLCIVPILVYVLPKQVQKSVEASSLYTKTISASPLVRSTFRYFQDYQPPMITKVNYYSVYFTSLLYECHLLSLLIDTQKMRYSIDKHESNNTFL